MNREENCLSTKAVQRTLLTKVDKGQLFPGPKI